MLSVSRAYENIEKAITYGFLTVAIRWQSDYLLLKNITDKEYHNLNYFRKDGDSYSDLLYHITFCTAMINNENFLEGRYGKIRGLVDFYASVPMVFLLKVRDAIRKLNDEFLESIDFLEGFCYTSRSRYLWKVLDLSRRDEFVGFPGLSNTGLNSVQENWIVINKRLDEEDDYKKDFNLAIMIASSNNPKGAKAISKGYETQMRELDELRKEIAEFGHDKKRYEEQHKPEGWAGPLRTKEDLVKELVREMSGHKDKHDLFIDKWLELQRRKSEEAKKKAEEKLNAYRKQTQIIDTTSVEDSMSISTDELNRRLKGRKDEGTSRPYIAAYENVTDKEMYLKKLSSTVIRSDSQS